MDHEDTCGDLVDLIIPLFLALVNHLFQFELLLHMLVVRWVRVAVVGGTSVRAAFVMDTVPNDHVAFVTRDRIAKCESQAPLETLH